MVVVGRLFDGLLELRRSSDPMMFVSFERGQGKEFGKNNKARAQFVSFVNHQQTKDPS